MIEAMIFRTRTGCPWRDLPDIFGPWKSLSTRRHRWHRWHRLGPWDAVWRWLEPCATGPLRPFDATHIKLHQSATNPVGGQCFQAIGRAKRGLNPKLTALADGQGRARQGRVGPGQRSDGHFAEQIATPAGKRVIADKGHDSDKLRGHFARGGARTGIAPDQRVAGRFPCAGAITDFGPAWRTSPSG